MIHRTSHAIGDKPPAIYIDTYGVFVRGNFTSEEITEELPDGQKVTQTSWTYEEDYLELHEYHHAINNDFSWVPLWDDGLRSFQRSIFYDIADEHIMKYMTDVPDEAMKQAWIAFKAAVRATQKATGYPEQVVYPVTPE